MESASKQEFEEKFYISVCIVDNENKMTKLHDERDLFSSYDKAMEFGKKFVKERMGNRSDLDFIYGFQVNKITIYNGDKNNG